MIVGRETKQLESEERRTKTSVSKRKQPKQKVTAKKKEVADAREHNEREDDSAENDGDASVRSFDLDGKLLAVRF
tara:strand:- start:60 stop:284 length:225 start_codon:yes stop_codon:yes gene_type:complete